MQLPGNGRIDDKGRGEVFRGDITGETGGGPFGAAQPKW